MASIDKIVASIDKIITHNNISFLFASAQMDKQCTYNRSREMLIAPCSSQCDNLKIQRQQNIKTGSVVVAVDSFSILPGRV